MVEHMSYTRSFLKKPCSGTLFLFFPLRIALHPRLRSLCCRKAPIGVGHALFVLSDDQLTRIFHSANNALCYASQILCCASQIVCVRGHGVRAISLRTPDLRHDCRRTHTSRLRWSGGAVGSRLSCMCSASCSCCVYVLGVCLTPGGGVAGVWRAWGGGVAGVWRVCVPLRGLHKLSPNVAFSRVVLVSFPLWASLPFTHGAHGAWKSAHECHYAAPLRSGDPDPARCMTDHCARQSFHTKPTSDTPTTTPILTPPPPPPPPPTEGLACRKTHRVTLPHLHTAIAWLRTHVH